MYNTIQLIVASIYDQIMQATIVSWNYLGDDPSVKSFTIDYWHVTKRQWLPWDGRYGYLSKEETVAKVPGRVRVKIYATDISGLQSQPITVFPQDIIGHTHEYPSLLNRPGDDDFHKLEIKLDSDAQDEIVIYDSITGTYKKQTKANFITALDANDTFLIKTEEYIATEGQVLFELTKGLYVQGRNRITVSVSGVEQPPSTFIETSNKSVTLINGLHVGTHVLLRWYELSNVVDIELPVHNHNDLYYTRSEIDALNDTYVHNQIIANQIWTIQHNLHKYPSVMIIDSGGNEVIGEVQYTSQDELLVGFSSAFSGRAYLN